MKIKNRKNIIKNFAQLAIIILIFVNVIFAEDPGTSAYKKGKYKKAYNYYKYKLDNEKKNNPILSYNTATAAQKLGQFKEAENDYLRSLNSENTELLSKVEYNLGQVSLKKKDLQQALGHFKKSIRYAPNDFDNKAMYETVRKLIEKQKQQNKNQQQKNNKQNQKKDQKQNKDSNKQSKKDKSQSQKENQKQKNNKQEQSKSGDQSNKNTIDNKKMQEMEKKNVTKQQAANILDAVKERELESMKKLIRYNINGEKIKRSKDW